MTKQIQVEVQSDHLDKVSKSSALTAVSELVWNAFDADANNVEVLIESNDLGISAIHVKDDGHGIEYSKAEQYFRGLGGSWKSLNGMSPKGRFLHGKEGQGRFKSFSIGRVIEWNTRYKNTSNQYHEYSIKGIADNKTIFSLASSKVSCVTKSGTTVSIYEPLKEFSSLQDDRLTDHLTSSFAIYLSTYGDAVLFVNGTKVNPSLLITNTETHKLPKVIYEGKEFDYELEIIEWNSQLKNEIQLCNEAGFPLLPFSKKIKGNNEVSYTAYLKSGHISELSRVGVLGLGEMETSLKKPLAEATKYIKDYLIRRKIENSSNQIEKWKKENVYPFTSDIVGHIEKAERQMFDILALNIHELMPQFDKSALQMKKFQFSLLKQIVTSKPGDLHTILTEVLNLSEDKQQELAELLKDASLSGIISAAKVVTDRLKFISGLEEILFNQDIKKVLKERSQLHKILEENTWIFGEQFSLSISDKSLTKVLKKHLKSKGVEVIPDSPVKRLDDSVGIVDLMLTRNIARNHPSEREHLIVELKAPKVKVGQKEIGQIESYAYAVSADERFKSLDTKWNFWIISNELDEFARRRLKEDKNGKGIIYNAEGVVIWVKTWAELINECKHRLEFVRSQLELNVDSSEGLAFLRKHYVEFTQGLPSPD
jgi:hypothetical protein